MTGSKLLLGVFTVCLACNNQQAPAVNNDTVAVEKATSNPQAEGNGVDQEMMKRIDSTVGAIKNRVYATRTAYFLPNGINDTLKTMLSFEDDTALRMQYSTFEDGGAAVGTNDLYFDKVFGVIKETQSANGAFYECITFDGRYISFRRSIQDGSFKKLDVPVGAVDGLTGILLRMAHDLKQLYPDIKFDIPEISLKGDTRLKTIAAIPLYETPDTNAHKIRLLKDRSIVGFIRTNDTIGSFGNKQWIWYFVKSSTDSGWIVGHPDFVQELTDENAED
ncbi:hypothetical protein [Chitinophaga filiformis]|uniref:Uncharacterized protein n=1 Tax=Chitinophaga filiformis TaxID=104663 RepID=A0A1G7LB60_CHIFI|nr:hypothetical protein [Chitinophaga filiformis]SDF46792.1 hypothetical protein SAMN04488121_1028 [Chitinophaga filiformis]